MSLSWKPKHVSLCLALAVLAVKEFDVLPGAGAFQVPNGLNVRHAGRATLTHDSCSTGSNGRQRGEPMVTDFTVVGRVLNLEVEDWRTLLAIAAVAVVTLQSLAPLYMRLLCVIQPSLCGGFHHVPLVCSAYPET